MTCTLCNHRKDKRFCLAVHGRICAQCCGEQREVTLDCPSDCPYLQQARQHEKPKELGDIVPPELFPAVTIREEFLGQHEQLITGILHTLSNLSRANPHLRDREVIGALTNVAKAQQTLASSGLVYEEAVTNPAQQVIVSTLQQVLQEFRDLEHKHLGYARLQEREVLQALVFALRLAHMHTSGRPLSRAWIDFLQGGFAPEESTSGGTAEAGTRIIMP